MLVKEFIRAVQLGKIRFVWMYDDGLELVSICSSLRWLTLGV